VESCEADASLTKPHIMSTNDVTGVISLFSVQQQYGNIRKQWLTFRFDDDIQVKLATQEAQKYTVVRITDFLLSKDLAVISFVH